MTHEGEVVVLVPHCQVSDLLPIGCLIVAVDQSYHRCVVSKLDDCVGVMCGGAVMGKQVVQKGTKHTPLRGSCSDGQLGGWIVAYPHHLGAARQEVPDTVAEGSVQSQGPELGDELGNYGVKC